MIVLCHYLMRTSHLLSCHFLKFHLILVFLSFLNMSSLNFLLFLDYDLCYQRVLNNSSRLTLSFDSSDSYKLIGLINSHANLPVPVCVTSSMFAGTAEPVNINCPSESLWSTSNLIASHSFGAICHSSISLGVSHSSSKLGLMYNLIIPLFFIVSTFFGYLWDIFSVICE